MRYFVNLDGEEHIVDVSEKPGGGYVLGLSKSGEDESSRVLEAEVAGKGELTTVQLGGKVIDLVVEGALPKLEIFASGKRASVTVESARTRAAAAMRGGGGGADEGLITSPMPGKVVKILVKEGDSVTQGAPIIVVEAMKMENELLATKTGVVQKVYVSLGDTVEGGARLIALA
jgi:glutaconyl-CoA/methylmalonyl-CoA decarboxylase subunit gamma